MEVMLGKTHRIVAKVVGKFDELGQLSQHALVELRPHPSHACLDIGARTDARQAKYRCFHFASFPSASGCRFEMIIDRTMVTRTIPCRASALALRHTVLSVNVRWRRSLSPCI